MEHRLLTVMFVDMQGYTRRSAEQTIDEMKLFHDELRDFVQKSIEGHGGTLVKSLGDGFLVRFDTPTRAVQAGLELQKRIETRNQNILNPEKFVRFRIGINTGEVGVDEQGDLFGDPVNIASRIQNFAEPNAVFISESTFLAMNRNEFGAQDLGPQEFKNATREIRVYKIQGKMAPTGKTAPAAAVVSRAAQPSLSASAWTGRKIALLTAFALAAGLPLMIWSGKKLFRKRPSASTATNASLTPPALEPPPSTHGPNERPDVPGHDWNTSHAPQERGSMPARPDIQGGEPGLPQLPGHARPDKRRNGQNRERPPEMIEALFRPLTLDLTNTQLQIPRHARKEIEKLQEAVKRKEFKAAWRLLDEMEQRVPAGEREFMAKLSIAFTRVDVLSQAGRINEAQQILKKISEAEPRIPPPLKEPFGNRVRELAHQLSK